MDSAATATRPASDQATFSFVEQLAYDLNRKEGIDIPSFPDIAMRVKKVVEDENSSADKIARVVGSEPGLAARLLKMANSAAINRSGRKVLDVKTAVSRLGREQIRASATSYAMQNLMGSSTSSQLKPYLTKLWNHSIHVAAIAYSLGRRTPGVNADEAMFVGLMHDIGKLYILNKIQKFPDLISCPRTMEHILNDWHTAIGKSILENWHFPEHVLDAIDVHEDHDRRVGDAADLADVVIVANLFSNTINEEGEPVDFSTVASCSRMGIEAQEFHDVMLESKSEIDELANALRG